MLPQIEWFGLTITEPMTTLTDYILAGIAILFGTRLIGLPTHRQHTSRRLWGFAFGFIAIGALLGGTSHGFVVYLSDENMALIWQGTLYSIGFSMFFVLAGTVTASLYSHTWRKAFYLCGILIFALYSTKVLHSGEYVFALLNNIFTFLLICGLQIWAMTKYGVNSATWILSGVGISVIGAVVQRSGYDFHLHFNHNDLYHVLQMVGLWFFYRGATLFVDAIEQD